MVGLTIIGESYFNSLADDYVEEPNFFRTTFTKIGKFRFEIKLL